MECGISTRDHFGQDVEEREKKPGLARTCSDLPEWNSSIGKIVSPGITFLLSQRHIYFVWFSFRSSPALVEHVDSSVAIEGWFCGYRGMILLILQEHCRIHCR